MADELDLDDVDADFNMKEDEEQGDASLVGERPARRVKVGELLANDKLSELMTEAVETGIKAHVDKDEKLFS